MPRRVLDTNILINHWGNVTRGNRRPRDVTRERAIAWGRQLIRLQNSNLILTPVYLEYVCGQGSRQEVGLARAYLSVFDVADNGVISDKDWLEARRIAERVPTDGLRRQMGDCLIRAICNRLHLDVLTAEKRFPH